MYRPYFIDDDLIISFCVIPFYFLVNKISVELLMCVQSKQDLQNIVEIFMGQLRQLFGLKSQSFYVGSSGKVNLLASICGFTKW